MINLERQFYSGDLGLRTRFFQPHKPVLVDDRMIIDVVGSHYPYPKELVIFQEIPKLEKQERGHFFEEEDFIDIAPSEFDKFLASLETEEVSYIEGRYRVSTQMFRNGRQSRLEVAVDARGEFPTVRELPEALIIESPLINEYRAFKSHEKEPTVGVTRYPERRRSRFPRRSRRRDLR